MLGRPPSMGQLEVPGGNDGPGVPTTEMGELEVWTKGMTQCIQATKPPSPHWNSTPNNATHTEPSTHYRELPAVGDYGGHF